MDNNELQLTDLEQQVLEAFCELYCDFVINKGDPVPRRHIKGRCNLSNYKILKALKSLREKGLIKLVREYYEGDLEEEAFMMIGYRPTEFYGKIILLTGRNEICKEATNTWAIKNIFEYGSLYSIIMRPKNDYRSAHEVKKDLIEKHIGFENILFAFDDDDKVNEMYKKHGVTCYRPNITNVV